MKIIYTIKKLETLNIEINNEVNKKEELPVISYEILQQLENQNLLINNLIDEFNLGTNSLVYKFKNTEDSKVKIISFASPVYFDEVYLVVNNFIYTELVKFKITFHTIDNIALSFYMLPYDFRGEYYERVKFYSGQKKSDFKTINSDKVYYYDVVKTDGNNEVLKKVEFDYTDYIDDEGYIVFKQGHKKDVVAIKYTPISSSFKTYINDRISSVTLELDKEINNEIELRA